MYSAYFGLDENPFAITPDPRYLYLSKRHREALAHLLYGIGAGGGFVQLTGEIGMGKTTLCRGLLEQLPDNVDVALILNPRVTALELVASICDELHVAYPADTTSLKVLIDALNATLLDAHARGRRTVLIIDEAQNLGIEVLEQVRLLTNLETAREKLLQIILIGQPELKYLLERDDLRQLAQRITARYHLTPLTLDETRAYIQHRLHVAGSKGTLFTPAALRNVHRRAGGIPRLINVICDRAMLGAYARDKQRITSTVVRKAAHEVLSEGRSIWRHPWLRWSVGTAAAVAAAAWLWLNVRPPAVQNGATPAAHRESKAPPQQIKSAPVPVPVSADAAPPSAESVEAWLKAASAAAASETTAFQMLFAERGIDVPLRADLPACEQLQQSAWRCVRRTGTWNNLRRYEQRAVLTLTDGSGARYQVLATPLPEGQVLLQAGAVQRRFPIGAVDPWWFGEYTLLWQMPAIQVSVLMPGMQGADVLWLRERLDALLGPDQPPPDPVRFDAALQARVMAFQRSRGLRDDGIVGLQTLIELSLTASPADRHATGAGAQDSGG